MKDELKTAFSDYIQKVKTAIGGKKALIEKRKTSGKLTSISNPIFWLNDQIEQLEKTPEFIKLVSTSSISFGGKPLGKFDENQAEEMKIFLRRSGCYLEIWDGNSVNIGNYFEKLWSAYDKKIVTTITLRLLGWVEFPENIIDFGPFQIQSFKKEELDDLCQNRINRFFYPDAEWNTEDLRCFYFIREASPKEKKPDDFWDFLDVDFEDAWFGRVKSKFHDSTIKQLVLFDWNVRNYTEQTDPLENLANDEKHWNKFAIPIILRVNNDLLKKPLPVTEATIKITSLYWDSDQETGKAIQLFPPTDLEQDELEELKELVKNARRFIDIGPDQWKFLDIAMGYLAKAFFTEGLEQLLWHMVVLEALFCLKDEDNKGIQKRIEERMSITLGDDKGKIHERIKKLYDLRSDLVHAKIKPTQAYVGDLWQARDFARRSVVRFLNYLLDIHEKLNSERIKPKIYPEKKEILKSLDQTKEGQNPLDVLLKNWRKQHPPRSRLRGTVKNNGGTVKKRL